LYTTVCVVVVPLNSDSPFDSELFNEPITLSIIEERNCILL
jgi:hypothetical protein